MRRREETWRWAIGGMTMFAVACSFFMPQSHVRDGALYLPGDAKYDAYFNDVHAVQAESATFADDLRAGRRPLVEALKLTMDSPESAIVQGAHERMLAAVTALGGGAKLDVVGFEAHIVTANGTRGDADTDRLLGALESDARAELDRAKRMAAIQPKSDLALQTGHTLEPTVRDDFLKVNAEKAAEVRRELIASFDVLANVSADAKRGAREAQTFVEDIQRAVAVGAPPVGDAPATASGSSSEADAGEGASGADAGMQATPTAAPKPPPQVYHPPPQVYHPPPPRPAPQPAPTSTGEVFNP